MKNPTKIDLRQRLSFVSGFTLFIILFFQTAFAQNGADLYDENCAVCHEISEQKLTGPGLLGVTEKHDENWLIQFIRNSQEMIEAGDEKAIALFKEYNQVVMPSMPNLSEDDIKTIIDHIRNYDPESEKVSLVADLSGTDYSEGDIKRGERLFRGLIDFENNENVCAACHNTTTLDTLNWNPSAYELAHIYEEKGPEYIAGVLKKPSSRTMREVHKNSTFTDEEIYFINAYLSEMAHTGLEEAKFFPLKLMTFLGLGFLMTLALIDLFITKRIRFKVIHIVILIAGIAWQLKIVSHEAIALSRTPDYQPDQPIKFSHAIHAGHNQTDCKYCHHTADRSKSAGIPSANICLNCHNVVKEGSNSGKFEINKIHRAIEKEKTIEWVRVHKLPEHAFFSHAQHVNIGEIECETCHGAVEKMDILKQHADLSMGWCINCHRETEVQFMSNKYYSKYMKFHDDIKSGKMDKVTVEDIGGLDCMKCHY